MNAIDPLLSATPGVAVFGASDAEPASPTWELAYAVGLGIARCGLSTVTGGYGGVMEAACQGARSVGGAAVGVTCPVFRGRRSNPHLTLELAEDGLLSRTARLFALARGFVVLRGAAGTLAELACLWAYAAAGILPGPIVLLDEGWSRLATDLAAQGRLDWSARRATRTAADPVAAVELALLPVDEPRP